MHIDPAILAALIGAPISVLMGALLKWYAAARKDKIRVVRIKDPDKQKGVLTEALQIYQDEERISEEDKDASADIIRWLREIRDEKAHGNCKLEDYFLVARTGKDVSGMAYAHFYLSAQMAFFSYLVVPRPSERDSGLLGNKRSPVRVSSRLVAKLGKELLRTKKCKAVVTEVEEPSTITDGKRKSTAESRILVLQHLASELAMRLWSIRIPYRQPSLDLDPKTKEKPLRLMIVFPETSENGRLMPRPELDNILSFLAESIYGDQFEDYPEKDKKYRAYLTKWKAKLMKSAPQEIELY